MQFLQATTLGEVPMASDPSPFAKTWHGLKCLAEVHAWETEHLPFLRTASGRELYFLIADQLLKPASEQGAQLKSLSLRSTGRIMRTRIQEFVTLGLVTVGPSPHNLRSKTLTPTPRLMEIFHEHTVQLRQAIL